ncbi:MAG: hypothetical protein Q4G33_14715 [bacterium]|nr:hypothetical protein [bacterium]
MKKFKKIIALGLATMAAVSSMSMSASAMTEIYDEAGENIWYVYTKEDLKDGIVPGMMSTFATFPMTSTQPTYDDARNLASSDISQSFSLNARNIKYSKSWYGSGSNFGVFFNDFSSNATNFTVSIYEVDADDDLYLVSTGKYNAADVIGFGYPNLSKSGRYCLKITNNTASTVTGSPIITNNIKKFFN